MTAEFLRVPWRLGTDDRMNLASHCAELNQIAACLCEERAAIACMRCHGEAPEAELEAASIAAGIAQLALLIQPLQIEVLDLETAAAWVS